MASEIQKTFDFFAATSAEGRWTSWWSPGGCALTPNLLQILRERFGVPVELMDPFRRVQVRESDFDAEWLRSVAPMLAVAVGLAIPQGRGVAQ
jgi:type IV pilus assembly protein PilM